MEMVEACFGLTDHLCVCVCVCLSACVYMCACVFTFIFKMLFRESYGNVYVGTCSLNLDITARMLDCELIQQICFMYTYLELFSFVTTPTSLTDARFF